MIRKRVKQFFFLILGAIFFTVAHLFFPYLVLSKSFSPAQQFQTLAKADKLYLAGKTAEAEKLYRKAKRPFDGELPGKTSSEAITDPSELTGAAKIFWREAKRGWDKELESATLIPLKMLIKREPRFVPGHMLMIEALKKFSDDPESDETQEKVLAALETAASQFPESAELTKLQVTMLADADKYLEASIAARQYAIMNPDNDDAPEFSKLAERYFSKFQAQKNRDMIISGVLGGVINIVSGRGLDQSVRLLPWMLQGESKMGASLAEAGMERAPQIDDPEILNYIDEVGQNLATLMGRKDFNFKFSVINNPVPNAFAYPGGKIYFHTGMLMLMDSEAELAGIIGHEVGHAVLSHSYQRMTQGTLLSSIGNALPLGKIINLAVLSYNRGQEKQSDIVGTRAAASAKYAADGARNVMLKLAKLDRNNRPEYLQTHPVSKNRVRYLEELIQQNGYNRYAFEGVERYAKMKKRLKALV